MGNEMPDENGSWPDRDTIAAALARRGKSASECASLIASVTESPATHLPIRVIKESLRASGLECQSDSVERVLLGYAIQASLIKIGQLRVPASVRDLIRRQFHHFNQPPRM